MHAQGQELPVIHRHPTRKDLIRYAAVSEDFSWQHWDQEHMKSLGFPSVIVHGWLTLTYMCQAVTEWMPPDRATVLGYDVRYKRPTFPGEITCGGKVEGAETIDGKTVLNLSLWAKGADGGVTTTATMRLRLDD